MTLRRLALPLIVLSACAVIGALLGARGDDQVGSRSREFVQSGEGSQDSLLPYALRPADLPSQFRDRLHTEAASTNEYPGVDGNVDLVISVVFVDDPFVAAAFRNLEEPGSVDSTEIQPATSMIYVTVLRLSDASAARSLVKTQTQPSDGPHTVLTAFEDGDAVPLTEEDIERTWVTRLDETTPAPEVAPGAVRNLLSVAQLDYDHVGDAYRSDRELRRDTTESYLVVRGRYVIIAARTVSGVDSALPEDVDLSFMTRTLFERLATAPD